MGYRIAAIGIGLVVGAVFLLMLGPGSSTPSGTVADLAASREGPLRSEPVDGPSVPEETKPAKASVDPLELPAKQVPPTSPETKHSSMPKRSDAAPQISTTPASPATPLTARALLLSAGMPESGVAALLKLDPACEQPGQRTRVEALAQAMGRVPRTSTAVKDVLQRSPELAPWVAASQNPEAFCKAVLKHPQDLDVLLNILVMQTDLNDADALAETWGRFGPMIAQAWRSGLPGIECLVRCPTTGPGDQEYVDWLADLFGEAHLTNDALVSRVVLALMQGPELRYRLSSDEGFRTRFRHELWPRFLRVTRAARRPMELFAHHPHVWDLLSRPDGEELAKAYGVIPTEILFGEDAYPVDVQPRALALMKSKKQVAMEALRDPELRTNRDFHALLRRQIAEPILLRACDELRHPMGGNAGTLSQLTNLSDRELEERYREVKDLETWDDNLPAMLKVPSRWITGTELDDNDLQKLTVEVSIQVLSLGSGYFIPEGTYTAFVKEGIEKVTGDLAIGLSDEDLRRRRQAWLQQSERVSRSMLPRDRQAAIDAAFAPQLVSETLQVAQQIKGGQLNKDVGEMMVYTVHFFHDQAALWSRHPRRMARNSEVLLIDPSERVWIVPAEMDSLKTVDRSRNAWRKAALERWMSLLPDFLDRQPPSEGLSPVENREPSPTDKR